MNLIDRRRFLTLAGAAGAALSLEGTNAAHALAPAQDFDFLFFTDTHIEPTLNADKGCAMAFKHMRRHKAAFAIQGGDHVIDSLETAKPTVLGYWDLYDKTQQDLGLKVHHTLGNHDVLGLFPKSGVATDDPDYGKKFFRDHIGPTFYSFDHKGVHFIVLDSIGIKPDRDYEGRVDADQIAWLKKDLAAQSKKKPIIVTTHIPLVSAIRSYIPEPKPGAYSAWTVANSEEVIENFYDHNVLGVLQGHTHINERVVWRGVPYITSGAVCGNWWHGPRMGTPEGYTVVSVHGGKLSTRYETYGFKTIDPKDS